MMELTTNKKSIDSLNMRSTKPKYRRQSLSSYSTDASDYKNDDSTEAPSVFRMFDFVQIEDDTDDDFGVSNNECKSYHGLPQPRDELSLSTRANSAPGNIPSADDDLQSKLSKLFQCNPYKKCDNGGFDDVSITSCEEKSSTGYDGDFIEDAESISLDISQPQAYREYFNEPSINTRHQPKTFELLNRFKGENLIDFWNRREEQLKICNSKNPLEYLQDFWNRREKLLNSSNAEPLYAVPQNPSSEEANSPTSETTHSAPKTAAAKDGESPKIFQECVASTVASVSDTLYNIESQLDALISSTSENSTSNNRHNCAIDYGESTSEENSLEDQENNITRNPLTATAVAADAATAAVFAAFNDEDDFTPQFKNHNARAKLYRSDNAKPNSSSSRSLNTISTKSSQKMRDKPLARTNSGISNQSTSARSDDTIPSRYRCCITHDLMRNPVNADDGRIYDRKPIKKWLRMKGTSPMTRQRMRASQLRPDETLQNEIKEWMKRHEQHESVVNINMAEAREAEGIHSTSSLNTSDSIVNDDTRREAGHKKMLCGCATFMGLFIVFHLLVFSVIKPQNEENLTLSDSNNDVRPYVVSNSTSFCEIGESQIRLEIYTDRYASETSWKVEPLNDPSKILFQSESGGLKNQNLHIWEFCLPAPSEEEDDNGGYILSITDFEGDGICCMKGMGWYRVAFEGTDIAHGGDFGSQDVIALFGGSGNNII